MAQEYGNTPKGHRVETQWVDRDSRQQNCVFVYNRQGTAYRVQFPPSRTADEVAKALVAGREKDPWGEDE